MTDPPNPAGSGAVASAAAWLQGTLLGTVATTIAIIAVGSVGFLMFTGRIDVRRAAQVVLGCFIIFGAATIAQGVIAAFNGSGANPELAQASPPPPPMRLQPTANPRTNSSPYDPYAGAALPPR